MSEISLELKNIKKSFQEGEDVLESICLTAKKGEFVTIVGASGAGKTTLLQILGTLDKADNGTIKIANTLVNDLSNKNISDFRNKNIGFVFQFHQLLPEFTALENVMIPALIGKKSKKEAEHEAKELLLYLGLSERLGHKPNELSGGEKQRVAVARALINRPSVILADEPSGSLDSKNKQELHQLLFKLRDEFNLTLLVVTHDKELATISDRIIEMQDGKII